MSFFNSTTSAYTRGDPTHPHDVLDIWFKVAEAVSPELERVPHSVFNKLRERYWVLHPRYNESQTDNHLDVHAFNGDTPYTDIVDFYSGTTFTVCTEGYVDEVKHGRVPGSEIDESGYTGNKWGFVDCREDDREGNVDGKMLDPTDAACAQWPGPYEPGPEGHNIKYFQFVANSAQALDEGGELCAQVRDTIQELLTTVMWWTSEGRRILFHCKNGKIAVRMVWLCA